MDDQSATHLMQVSPHYYFKKALSFMRLEKISDAISHIDSAIVFSNHCPFYIYQKIKFLFAANHFSECSSYILDQAYFLYKHASLYILCRAVHYYQLINHLSPDALREVFTEANVPYCLTDEYQNILDANPSNLLTDAKKAVLQDNFQLCIDYCSLIIKQNKATSEVLYLTGYAYHMISDLPKACEHYKKCLKLNPEYDTAYKDLGLALMELGEFNEALSYLDKARTLNPNQPDYLSHMAECYYYLKEYALAEKTLETLLNFSPFSLQTYFDLSHICKRQNKKHLSKKYMKKAKKNLKNNNKKIS